MRIGFRTEFPLLLVIAISVVETGTNKSTITSKSKTPVAPRNPLSEGSFNRILTLL